MILLGITGGIGSGKSIICSILETYGIPVYIADIESKKLVDSSDVIREKISSLLGDSIYVDNRINKKLLASFIFRNNENLKMINNIIHPIVREDFKKWIEDHKRHPIIAQESAILFESGFYKLLNKIVTVCSPIDLRIDRVMQRDNCPKKKVMIRIDKQLSDEEKVKRSDFIIYNNEKESLIAQTLDLINKLLI